MTHNNCHWPNHSIKLHILKISALLELVLVVYLLIVIIICICVTYMSDLLLNWLNDEIQLSKRINSFEEDFHNGFLLGELLAKYSQQLNFHQFVDKDDKASKIKNFSLLFETFSALKITYDSHIAMKIINKQLGVAKKMLYELKTQLQKTNTNTFSKTNRMSKTLSPLKKIQISKQKFDQANKQHFVKQLNQLHPAQKEIIHQRLLKKFGDFQSMSTLRAHQDQESQKQSKNLLRNRFIQQQRQNLKKSEEFRKQWQADHLEKWAVNMTIRQTQLAKDDQFKSKIQFEKSHYKTMSEMNAIKSLDNDIAEFQKKNLVKKQDDSDEQQAAPQQVSKLMEKTEQQQLRVKEQGRDQRRLGAAQTEKRKHQREKRRRKMIVEQQKRYQLIEINRRERIIINTIEQTSKQEKQIQYEIWRAWENKNIIIENKSLYTQKINQKEEMRSINAKFKRDQLLKTYREEHRQEVDSALRQNTQLQRSNQVAIRKNTYKSCQDMILQLLDITENMYVSCQERNTPEISSEELQTALIKFTQGTKTKDQESSLKLKHYIEGTHQWGFKIVRPEEQVPTDPKEDNALPNENVNNYYLGNILHNIFQQLYTKQSQGQSNIQSNDRLLISLVGLDYARKQYLAQQTRDKYKFNVINVDRLIEAKIKDWINFKQKGIQNSDTTEQLAQRFFTGQPISDQLVIQLIKQEVEKNPQSILVDYPNTYNQAIQLCKVLGNIQPHDMLNASKLTKKIQQYQRLVKGTQSRIVERKIRQCGVSFVWWVDVSIENSLDRMLGRRWIGNKQVHIDQDIEPQRLRQGQKAAALVSNNNFKLKNKERLREWFTLFGTQFGIEEPVFRKCWQELNGNCDTNKLQETFTDKIKDALQVKSKQKSWNEKLSEQQKKINQKKAQQKKAFELLKTKCVKSSSQNIKTQLQNALQSVSLNKDFIEQMAQLWNKIQNSTINSLTKAFQSLEQQEQNQKTYLAKIKRSFIQLLTRVDHKFYLIKDFQNEYNQFIAQNEDMLAYDYTKEQLHQRVEDLQNNLLAIIEEKKEDASGQKTAVMTSGWLESQLDIISESILVLVQTELNRYAASEKILTDYYAKRFMANTKAYEPLNPDVNLEAISATQIYKDGACLRIQKLISQALRILNREEQVVDDKNKKGGKGAPPPKKDDKKAAKKGGKEEVQENKQPTAEQLELKKAINTEKAILRQRLNRIKSLGQFKLKNTYQSAQKLYTELQDLYVYTDKVQKKAVLGLTKIFRKSIESQQKIQSQVQINHVEVIQAQSIRNFQKPKPIILTARQSFSDKNFTLANMQQIFELLKNEAEGSKISTKRLVILLKRIITNLQLRKLLPERWRSLKADQIEKFVKLLDYKNAAYVDLVKISLFIVMSGYSLPTAAQIEQYTLDLSNFSSLKETTQEKFVTTNAWFDENIEYKQNVRPFLRNDHVKQILFSLYKREYDECLQIGAFLKAIRLDEYAAIKNMETGTYFDFAFT